MDTKDFSALVRVVQHWVDPSLRVWIDLLFRFDAQMAYVARRPGPPELARIRLAWWREAVLATPASVRDPLLLRVIQCDAADRARLAAIVGGWDQITGMHGEEAWRAHAHERGDAVFASIAPGKWPGSRWALLSATRLWPDHPDAATARALGNALPHLPRSAPRALRLVEADVDPREKPALRWWRAMRG